MDISVIDRNFAINSTVNEPDIVWRNVLEPDFTLYGLLLPDAQTPYFHRLPAVLAAELGAAIGGLQTNTAGGRVRFRTDARYIAIHAEMHNVGKMPHFATTGSAGFDLYTSGEEGEEFLASYKPPYGITDGYEGIVCVSPGLKDYTVNFPLYSGVKALWLGFPKDAVFAPAGQYAYREPVVYYGSSITQGGCASRPGNSYEAILSRLLDCDHINLGFSGNAKGEPALADYIAGLPARAFVLDYDHNAPTPDHLRATHAPFYERVRAKRPELPIIMVTRPKLRLEAEERERRDIVRATYEAAVKAGDRLVWFVDGSSFFRNFGGDSSTVDNCHPNDLGFWCMAKVLEPILKEALSSGDAR